MEKFYKHLQTKNKVEALRNAKLDLMNVEFGSSRERGVGGITGEQERERVYSHPYYWAPFVLIGKYN